MTSLSKRLYNNTVDTLIQEHSKIIGCTHGVPVCYTKLPGYTYNPNKQTSYVNCKAKNSNGLHSTQFRTKAVFTLKTATNYSK